jgi:hypothetical protein
MLSVRCTDFIKVEQPSGLYVLSCRFSLSDTGSDVAQQLRDMGDASPSRPFASAAPCIIPVDMSGDGHPRCATPDGAAAINGDIATTRMSDNKEYHTTSTAAISRKKKTTAKMKDYRNKRSSSVSTVA